MYPLLGAILNYGFLPLLYLSQKVHQDNSRSLLDYLCLAPQVVAEDPSNSKL